MIGRHTSIGLGLGTNAVACNSSATELDETHTGTLSLWITVYTHLRLMKYIGLRQTRIYHGNCHTPAHMHDRDYILTNKSTRRGKFTIRYIRQLNAGWVLHHNTL